MHTSKVPTGGKVKRPLRVFSCGEGGIRTHGGPVGPQRFSRPPRSTTLAPLQVGPIIAYESGQGPVRIKRVFVLFHGMEQYKNSLDSFILLVTDQ